MTTKRETDGSPSTGVPTSRDGLDPATRRTLQTYMHDVAQLPNESAKRHRFSLLVGELFPRSKAAKELSEGIEKLVHITTTAGRRPRRIDSYYGNFVIEFEKSLRASERTAKEQLREYTAALWGRSEESSGQPLICVATDGLVWQTYRPTVQGSHARKPRGRDVRLDELRRIELTDSTLGEFWYWLTGLLFRDAQTDPSVERFRMDFGAQSPAYADAMHVLREAWHAVRGDSEHQLAYETWQKYLTVTYGTLGEGGREQMETLFLKHSYLVNQAYLLMWAALSRGTTRDSLRDVARGVLSGEFFRARGIENIVEEDFFKWVRSQDAERYLAPLWERILDQMLTYDLSRLNQDVLKGVYQELVAPEDRHDLGEYYTHEWLCERIVAELLPKRGFPAVIDPACGSGSFLRAAIAHMLSHNPDGGPSRRLDSVLNSVVGIDINPLAVVIARATYVLAVRSLLRGRRRAVHIPVYLADSLFLPEQEIELSLGESPNYTIGFGDGKSLKLPEDLVHSADVFDTVIDACTLVASAHAKSGKETAARLRAYLEREAPVLADRPDWSKVAGNLWRFADDLADLIRRRHNSIWAFIIRNGYRPAMLKGCFDYVIGNPPWLSYRYIAAPKYQEQVKKWAVDIYRVAPTSQRLMTHMELALVFMIHGLTTLGRDGAKLGFVMPRSLLNGDQYGKFRTGSDDAPVNAPIRVDTYWDLDDVKPLFKVPACVMFARRTSEPGRLVPRSLPIQEWHGKLPERDLHWKEAKSFLASTKATARLIWLGERTALSTRPGSTRPSPPSPYARLFRQGATIVPRNFYFARVADLEGNPEPNKEYWAETDPEVAESAKAPYRDVSLQGKVEGRFVFSTALSRHVLPFAMLEPCTVVLPVLLRGDSPSLETAESLEELGFRKMAERIAEAEEIWKRKRKKKASRQTVYERLGYHGGLSQQSLGDRYLVLYNAAGTNVCACVVDRCVLDLPFIVDHKLYWAPCCCQEEADYLAAILNAEAPNDVIKPFQSRGLYGERDIHKKILDLPIARFKQGNTSHRKLAELGARARQEAQVYLASASLLRSLAARREAVRTALSDVLGEIDVLVQFMLADYSE